MSFQFFSQIDQLVLPKMFIRRQDLLAGIFFYLTKMEVDFCESAGASARDVLLSKRQFGIRDDGKSPFQVK